MIGQAGGMGSNLADAIEAQLCDPGCGVLEVDPVLKGVELGLKRFGECRSKKREGEENFEKKHWD